MTTECRRCQQLEQALRGLLMHIVVVYPPGAEGYQSPARYIEWRHGMPGMAIWHLEQAQAALEETQ